MAADFIVAAKHMISKNKSYATSFRIWPNCDMSLLLASGVSEP